MRVDVHGYARLPLHTYIVLSEMSRFMSDIDECSFVPAQKHKISATCFITRNLLF